MTTLNFKQKRLIIHSKYNNNSHSVVDAGDDQLILGVVCAVAVIGVIGAAAGLGYYCYKINSRGNSLQIQTIICDFICRLKINLNSSK